MAVSIGRRELIAALSGAALWPLAVRAQQLTPLIGILGSGSAAAFVDHLTEHWVSTYHRRCLPWPTR